MKKINFLGMSILALLMACFTACENNHDVDHSADIVGTWTCFQAGYAEALVIKADGSALSTGYDGTDFWEDVAGKVVVKDGVVTMTFEDGDNCKGHFDIVPGVAFSIYEEDGEHYTFNYCANDLADEIIGMWVCNDGQPEGTNDIAITTYTEDGKMVMTHGSSDDSSVSWLNKESDYVLVGDIMIHILPNVAVDGSSMFLAARLIYTPDGTTFGDILTQKTCVPTENGFIESTSSFLRIKQTLDLANKKYDYIKTYITNVDGLDKTINFMDYEFNFAKIDGVKFDKMLKTILFAVEFPDANTIKYSCHYNNEAMALQAPIVVDGNKMTVKMSEVYSAAKDVDLYTVQDQDNTQMHMYMPTYSFVNFFANMQIAIMAQVGELDMNDAAAVKAVFDSIDEAVNTINISFVMTAAK